MNPLTFSKQRALPISVVENVLAYLDVASKNALSKTGRCWNGFMLGIREGPEFHLYGGYHPDLLPVECTKSREWSIQKHSSISKTPGKWFGCKIIPFPYSCSMSPSLDFRKFVRIWCPEDTLQQRFYNRIRDTTNDGVLQNCREKVFSGDSLQGILGCLAPLRDMISLAQVNWHLKKNILGSRGEFQTLSLLPTICKRQLEAQNSFKNFLTLAEFVWIQDLHSLCDVPFHAWPKISHLNLSNTKVDNVGLEWICKTLSNVTILSLTRCNKITELKALNKLSFLISLDLSNSCEFSDLSPLKEIVSLKFLYLIECYGVKDLAILSTMVFLERLAISGFPFPSLQPLVGLTLLKHLILNNCSAIPSEEVRYLEKLILLENLYTDLPMTDESLERLTRLPCLSSLVFYDCSGVSDEGFAYLTRCKGLTFLSLEKARQLTDEGLRHLRNIPSLQKLSIFDCHNITKVGFDYLSDIADADEHDVKFSRGSRLRMSGGNRLQLSFT